MISRIEDAGAPDGIILHDIARIRTEDGEEAEGVLSHPGSDLEAGRKVRVKYHPKHKINARLIG